jgi:DNA transformation protein
MLQQVLVDHCLELLAPLGRVRSRKMFGGWGLYVDELFIALIAFDRLYLKVDDDSRARFEAEGCEPFVYEAKGKRISVGYWSAPPEAMESPALMLPWARLAMQAALRAGAKAKPARLSRSRKSTPPTLGPPLAATTDEARQQPRPRRSKV